MRAYVYYYVCMGAGGDTGVILERFNIILLKLVIERSKNEKFAVTEFRQSMMFQNGKCHYAQSTKSF